ncbi:hypothetical protein HYDPIDRAFT_26375 [Hydnomerulius pinastri MD-312]|nr:hypothetical protein HYDPIDRAFT_26375 [Hydnomerulius pinastri MD-312]
MVRFASTLALAALVAGAFARPAIGTVAADIDNIASQVQSLNSAVEAFVSQSDNAHFQSIIFSGIAVHNSLVEATTAASQSIAEADGKDVVAALKASTTVFSTTLNYLVSKYDVFASDAAYVEEIAKSLVILTADTANFGLALAVNLPCDLRGDIEAAANTYVQGFYNALEQYTTVPK